MSPPDIMPAESVVCARESDSFSPLQPVAIRHGRLDRSDVPEWKRLVDQLPIGLLTFTADLQVVCVNEHFRELLGLDGPVDKPVVSVEQLLALSATLTGSVRRSIVDACTAMYSSGLGQALNFELAASSSEGTMRSFSLRLSHLYDGDYIAMLDEAAGPPAIEAGILERAMLDPLTGLPNRELFHHRAAKSLAVIGRAAILMIDLDRFKAVNDGLGHQIGDMLLVLVAKRLRAMLREGDTLARLGGDEFVIAISPPPDHDALGDLGRRIVDMLSRPYLIEGQLVIVGASVGLAAGGDDGTDSVQLLAHADLALFHAKETGRGTCRFYAAEMNTRALARRSLESELRKAVALQQFELHYQPQIGLEENRLEGFEALVRWRHPERGLVPPGEFIPLAEDVGLITAIGDWVLGEACVEAMRWPDSMSVAVNVSPRQFENPAHLIEAVRQALAGSGLPGHRLELEITESALLRHEQTILKALTHLRSMGVRLAMDDFGTGYSSLSQLQNFPFDKIKIDRSFVSDVKAPENRRQDAIVRAITALSAGLGMSTIAEGVETSEQLIQLRDGGCSSVQGYFISRPVPVAQVPDLIARFDSGRADVKSWYR